ncbi:DUF4126 family protein [Hymenobacter sp. BT175]|uniref:DUF4126 family protein n=1 Tax=Hymenobacter translucens TaxID=2886507 RepID=UPI001D0DC37C|nr:DUF4126 family protein [Hymenobacter translucens]MCC2547395.1 DUF4126 family protein [Hymenobacter translucens]
MASSRSSVFWRTVGLGLIAGMRSMSAPALLSSALRRHPSSRLAHSSFSLLQQKGGGRGLKLLAAAEMVGDKLPQMPDRTEPISIAGRALSGAVVGAVLYKLGYRKLVSGALLGGAAAVAGTFGAYYLRRAVNEKTSLQEPTAGFLEDAVVVGLGNAILHGYKPRQ